MATDEQKRYEMSLDPIEKMLNDELLEKWELLSFPYFLPNLFGDFPPFFKGQLLAFTFEYKDFYFLLIWRAQCYKKTLYILFLLRLMQAKNDYNFRGANQKEEPRLRSAKQDGRGSSNYTTRGKH